jgi:hypothetical protein
MRRWGREVGGVSWGGRKGGGGGGVTDRDARKAENCLEC